ncbi:MAG: BREX system P-loop protein BrxC [Desulfobacteraceae bacterium]|nr:BREX system P-loop protein BrxC [Desulfobacteraceae bacterium]
MQIKNIFEKDISRPINGVVKADQLNESVIWQELDEYVITRELDQHFRKFVSAYSAATDIKDGMRNDPTITDRMAVWISGFFGSGKSHFIKILSYLLGNISAVSPDTGESKHALDFFKDKIKDPMLFGDIKRIVGVDTDIILFNIDSRADANDGRTTLLSVFWRVFNESLGFCSQSLHLAEIERYLTKKGKYQAFKDKFEEIYGAKWEDERDAYSLLSDEIVEALSDVLGKSKEAAAEYFENSEKNLIVSVENFAKRVNEYLDSKSPGSPGSNDHRIVFLVDEIGQFIGSDTHLMLNLQTLVEDLGRHCAGRAWVLVTSQEDIDAVLGDIKSTKANDFSKIQGRFYTRLSLSSANTDEVIQSRLLKKNKDAVPLLEKLFDEKGDILKNQLSFSYDTSTLKNYSSKKDFVNTYPFTPYHFQLVQKIFESIRKAGATGLHLSRGERSMLDAFQSSAVNIAAKEIGALVPLYEFYPCIESFLDTSVKRSIEQAKDNAGLDVGFDIQILQALFLIRYVDIIKPNVENLVTLCIDQVDADRIVLKRDIEASLQRLEKETLINRNGDLYFFLTNEEREVSREIKGVEITSAAETELLGDIIFDDILKGKTKHKYTAYNRDYAFNRICDDRFRGKELQNELGLEIISPLHDEYKLFIPAKCNLYSSGKDGNLIVKLDDNPTLTTELRLYLQVKKYIENKSNPSASHNLSQILNDRAVENRERKDRLIALFDDLISKAEYYALGKKLDIDGQTTAKAINDGFDYLVKNIFSKFSYLTYVASDPLKEIKQILLSDDVAQHQLSLDIKGKEPPDIKPDIKEVKGYINGKTAINHSVILDELVKHFTKRPYGWGDFQVIILVAKLFMAGDIKLVIDETKIAPKDAIAPLSKTHQWKTVKIIENPRMDQKTLDTAKKLAKDMFGAIPPDSQEKLSQHIIDNLEKWSATLDKFKPLADTGNYPGKQEIDGCLAIIAKITKIHDAYERIKAFNESKDYLLDAEDDLQTVKDFYTNQKNTWENLSNSLKRFMPNKSAIEKNLDAFSALKRMLEIEKAPSPYTMIKEVDGLISRIDSVNKDLLQKQKTSAEKEVDSKIDQLKAELDKHNADANFRNEILFPIQQVKKNIQTDFSIPEISYKVSDTRELFEDAFIEIEDKFQPPDGKTKKKQTRTVKPSTYAKKVYLETEADVDEYVGSVKDVLLDAVKSDIRVKII